MSLCPKWRTTAVLEQVEEETVHCSVESGGVQVEEETVHVDRDTNKEPALLSQIRHLYPHHQIVKTTSALTK